MIKSIILAIAAIVSIILGYILTSHSYVRTTSCSESKVKRFFGDAFFSIGMIVIVIALILGYMGI